MSFLTIRDLLLIRSVKVRDTASGYATYQKGDVLEARVAQARAVSNSIEEESTSSGMRICSLSEDPPQTSSLHAEDPGTGEAAIMRYADPKKM
jgi:hypothetical protein